MPILRRLVKQQPIRFKLFLQSISDRSFSTVNPPPGRRTSTEFDSLIYAAVSSGDFDAVRRLLNSRIVFGCFNTSDTFKFLANTPSYSSLLEALRQTLPQTDGGLPRKNAYDILIGRLCKLNRIDDALSVISDMVRDRCSLTPSTFYPILCTLTRKNKIEEAWLMVELMRSHSVPVDVTVYNFFLTSHCYDGEVEKASDVMRQMEENEISPDTRTYDALILGVCRAGKVEAAMAILRKMEDDGVPVLYSTHAHILGEMVDKSYYTQAVEFVITYAGKDVRLDTESFGSLARKLIKRKRIEETKIVLIEMVKRGLRMGDFLREFHETHVINDEFD